MCVRGEQRSKRSLDGIRVTGKGLDCDLRMPEPHAVVQGQHPPRDVGSVDELQAGMEAQLSCVSEVLAGGHDPGPSPIAQACDAEL